MELLVSPRTERQSLFYPLSTSCLQISARGSRKQRVSCTRVVNRDADMHVHAESVQGCAIRVRGLVWHPLYVHYCTSDRYLLAPVSLSRAERILRSTGSAHALVHTLASRWTPSRLTLVRSPLSVLLARLGLWEDAREGERDFFPPFFSFSSSSSFFFFIFIYFILLRVFV